MTTVMASWALLGDGWRMMSPRIATRSQSVSLSTHPAARKAPNSPRLCPAAKSLRSPAAAKMS